MQYLGKCRSTEIHVQRYDYRNRLWQNNWLQEFICWLPYKMPLGVIKHTQVTPLKGSSKDNLIYAIVILEKTVILVIWAPLVLKFHARTLKWLNGRIASSGFLVSCDRGSRTLFGALGAGITRSFPQQDFGDMITLSLSFDVLVLFRWWRYR